MTGTSETKGKTTRRTFLRTGGAALAAGLVGALGWQARPVADPGFLAEPLSDGPDAAPKLLVAYASMMGSTGEQAALIAEEGRKAGYRTTLARVPEAPDPAGFDAVILGSAVRTSAWLDEMLTWAAAHETTLAARPHALFQCSMQCAGFRSMTPDHGLTPEQVATLRRDLQAIHAAAPALAGAPVEFFAGRLDYDYLKPPQRVLYPVVSGSLYRGDHRRPEQVRAYARATLASPAFVKTAS